MQVRWLGHASFLIVSGAASLITDPFDERCGYQPYDQPVSIATVSHDHWDHNAVERLAGSPQVIRDQLEPVDTHGMVIQGFLSYHDPNHGRDRGYNTLYKVSAENIDLLHMGDQGVLLDEEQIAAIGNVDILFLPVGGRYTMDAADAFRTVEQLKPRIAIPMHYQTPCCSIKELAPLEHFTSRYHQVVKRPFLTITREHLPYNTQVIILDYLPG